jgi:MraZ protein
MSIPWVAVAHGGMVCHEMSSECCIVGRSVIQSYMLSGEIVPGCSRGHGTERGLGMFLGEYQHTLDAKGRVSLPAKFRAEVTGSLVVSKGLDNCLYVYSADEYRGFVEDLTLGNDFNSKQRHLRRFFVAGAQEVELDSAGRISLSPALRDYAGLKKEIAVTGNGNRIEIWDSEAWATYNSEAEGSIEDLAEGLAEAGLF